MKLHVQYLRSLEDSERVRKACLSYMQTWLEHFYPDRMDVFAQLQAMAAELHGHLETTPCDAICLVKTAAWGEGGPMGLNRTA